MHKVTLVLCTSDERYASQFVNAVGFYSDGMIRTDVVRNVENLSKTAQDSEVPDMILMDPQMFIHFCRQKGIQSAEEFRQRAKDGEVLYRNVCILTEEENQLLAGIDLKNIPRIYKYRDMETILADIRGIFQSRESEKRVDYTGYMDQESSGCILIGFYSPIHRTGQSTYVRKMAAEAAENIPVLHLHLDSYAGDAGDDRDTLADLLYYFHQEDMVFQRILQKVTWKEERYHQILPMPFPPDLWNISVEEWRMLFQALKEKSIYRKVFIDFGDGRVSGLFELLEMCDVIYMPVENDSEALHKLTQYERTLTVLDKGAILEKTRRVYPENYGQGTNLERTIVR